MDPAWIGRQQAVRMLTTQRSTSWRRGGVDRRWTGPPLLRSLPAVVAVLVAVALNAPPALATTTPAAPGDTGSVAGSAAASTTEGWSGRIDWTSCPQQPDDPGKRCGTLRLPIDWTRPDGPTFPLAVARRAATDPATRIGVLVVNPGGPGLSAVDAALAADSQFGPDLLRRFDIIGFDPRGTGLSAPVRCSTALLDQQPSLAPADEAAYQRLLTYNRRLRDDCRAQSGPLFDHVDSASSARDMDALRAALGERQLSFYGLSYGTLIGQAYAELFPDRVRALVLDSVMDHSADAERFLRTAAASNEGLFQEFVTWCERNDSCALHGRDVPSLFDGLMRRADAGTLVDPDTGATLNWYELGFGTVGNFFEPAWAALATWLAALDREAATQSPVASRGTIGDAGEDLSEYALLAFCTDWSLPVDGFTGWNRYLALSRAEAPHLRASPLAVRFTAICLGWGTASNPQHLLRVRTSAPLLVLNPLHDPATPYDGALRVVRQLGGQAHLVTYEGSGHGAYPRTECIRGHVERYLVERVAPPAGASCPAAPA
jgi:pimeloyl-ACP methyl ester carboxylesterase